MARVEIFKSLPVFSICLFLIGCSMLPKTYRCRLVIPKGFTGEVRIEPDKGLKLDLSKIDTLEVKEGVVHMPADYFDRNGTADAITFVEVRESDGTVLTKNTPPSGGETGVLRMGEKSDPNLGSYKFLVVGKVIE